jgi:energy-converting hydrogenase Eha subunit G
LTIIWAIWSITFDKFTIHCIEWLNAVVTTITDKQVLTAIAQF